MQPNHQIDPFFHMRRWSQWIMGTKVTVALRRDDVSSPNLADRCFEILRYYDRLLNPFDENSALSKLNTNPGEAVCDLHPDLQHFLDTCQTHKHKTNGLFDICRTPRPFTFDPCGIGKGYALDEVIEYLLDQGVEAAFVDFGGSSFWACGHGYEQDGWCVAVTDGRQQDVHEIITLSNQALSCSSSLQDGKNHISDNNRQLVEECRTAVCIDDSATVAEVVSTALVADPSSWPNLNSSYNDLVTNTFLSPAI